MKDWLLLVFIYFLLKRWYILNIYLIYEIFTFGNFCTVPIFTPN